MLRVLCLTLLLACWSKAAPVFGPDVDTSMLHITLYASGLDFPQGMVQLSDGTVLAQTSPGFTGGSILRLQDTNNDGIVDLSASLFSFSSATGIGPTAQLVQAGGFFLQNNLNGTSISILEAGAGPGDALTQVGLLQFDYPTGSWHTNSGLAVRETAPGIFEVVFNIGAKTDNTHSTDQIILNGLGLTDVSLDGESLYMMTLNLNGASPVASNVHKVASGIRNVFGLAFAANGDLWFADNAIDAPPGELFPLQADELNLITATQLAGPEVPDFGFPDCYPDYFTGAIVGSGCIAPVAAFIPQGGEYSQGSAQIAFAPEFLPAPFNNGIFISFTGDGANRNPILYYSFDTNTYTHFILGGSMSLPTGLMATSNALFISDWGTGDIYRITAADIPEPGTGLLAVAGLLGLVAFTARRRVI